MGACNKKEAVEAMIKHYKDQNYEIIRRGSLVRPVSVLEMLDDLERAIKMLIDTE
jgi:hypothetical protein